METKVKASELLKRLKQSLRVIPDKTPLRILSNVLLDVRNDCIVITSSDSEMWFSVKCPVLETDERFSVCVNPKNLIDALKYVGDVDIKLLLDNESNTFVCEHSSGRTEMPFEGSGDFPTQSLGMTDKEELLAECHTIGMAIGKTIDFVANSITKPIMNGVNFHFCGGRMRVSSTDSFTIALYNAVCGGDDAPLMDFTLPKKPAKVLMDVIDKTDGLVKISTGDTAVSFSNGEFEMSARLLCGCFPKCHAVIPKECSVNATVDKEQLSLSIKRVLPMSDELSCLVVAEFFKDYVTLSTTDAFNGKSAKDDVKCLCDGEIKIGMKGFSVADILKNIEDENVLIGMNHPNSPIVFRPLLEDSERDYVFVLSPSYIQS